MNNTEKTKACRNILHYCKIGKYVRPEDFNFLIEIFQNHDEWIEKRGVGISNISTILTGYKNKCFVLHRTDGTTTDISYVASIKNISKLDNIKKACRNAIYPIIQDFKKNVKYGIDRCSISGDILTPENTHIDHYDLTFNEMFVEWLTNYNIEILYNMINKTKDNSTQTIFNNSTVERDFIEFHNNNTKLRAITKISNLSTVKINKNKYTTMKKSYPKPFSTVIPEEMDSFLIDEKKIVSNLEAELDQLMLESAFTLVPDDVKNTNFIPSNKNNL
jgi:hypothetical protein